MVGLVGEMASVKRCKLWKTGEGGLCCSSSAIQTRLGPSSLLEERSKILLFSLFLRVVGYPPNWGKRPRYIDDRLGWGSVYCALYHRAQADLGAKHLKEK